MSDTPAELRLSDDSLPANYPFRPDWEWTPAQVAAALKEEQVSLVDCRRAPELHVAKIEGTHWVPMDETPARLDALRALPQPLVIHCHHGVRSLRVAQFLRENGIEAHSMAAGIDQWSLAIDAQVPRY